MTTASLALPALRRVLAMPGVYAPQHDTRLLASALRGEAIAPGARLLDLCTGSGALAVYAADLGAEVTAVDISRRAVLTTRINALLARRRITVRRGDLGASLPAGSYDFIISNPPYVPTPGRPSIAQRAARAWDAGWDGRDFVDRICATGPALLRDGGVLLMVHSALCSPDDTVRGLARMGLRVTVTDRTSIPFGPVMRRRLMWLRERGLVAPSDEREELVIIRGQKP